MFKKILIANRGEIALRVIRTCNEMGISTVAVYSTADKDSLHVRFADEAVCIGPPASKNSYLSIPNIMSAAEITNADAIHPGYGFLSENAEFAEVCTDYNIKFIGPTAQMINAMGDKATAKATMKKAKVPVIPGSDGLIPTKTVGKKSATKIGYPVILKATAGGGGKGMRVLWNESEFDDAWDSAKAEAKNAFANDGIYLEKFIEEPRHVEIQIVGDQMGKAVHLSERDCTIQRRHQKLVEEAPSPVLDAARDLIKEQIRIAAGHPISGNNYEPQFHAIECRINAEDPFNNFAPCPGKITAYHTPKGFGVRVDTHAFAGYVVPPFYDSMIAKVIVRGNDRAEAIARMARALDEFIVEGIKTTIPFHKQLMQNEKFKSGHYNTGFIDEFELVSEETS